jgi:hypothetical protein
MQKVNPSSTNNIQDDDLIIERMIEEEGEKLDSNTTARRA